MDLFAVLKIPLILLLLTMAVLNNIPSSFKVASYNCCSLRQNIDIVRALTDDNLDLIFLQETMVVEEKLGLFDYISEDYDSICVAAEYSEKALRSGRGRPSGGLAILYRKNPIFKITKIVTDKPKKLTQKFGEILRSFQRN